jgi:hypothetical protein
MAITMKTQTQLAEEMAEEFAACGSEDVTIFQILDVLASTGISLIENSFLNLASEELQDLFVQWEG